MRPYSTFRSLEIVVTNAAPDFIEPDTVLPDVTVKFNNTFLYILPPYADPEGSLVYIELDSDPPLVKLFTQIVPPDTLSIHANLWN